MCLLTATGNGQNLPKCPKTAVFRNMGINEIVNTPWNRGGGWGLFVFHKYFLVSLAKYQLAQSEWKDKAKQLESKVLSLEQKLFLLQNHEINATGIGIYYCLAQL